MRASRILGLAVEERALLAVEVRANGTRCELSRAAEFTFPEGTSLDDPAGLGAPLRAFLRQHRFSAKRAVLGVPARWLLVKERAVPPTSRESLAGLLRIEAERELSIDVADLALDYADGPASDGKRRVLLVAALQRRVDQLRALAQAARLTPVAITSSALALAASGSSGSSALVLYIRPSHTDLVLAAGGGFSAVVHLPAVHPNGAETPPGAQTACADGLAARVGQAVSLLLTGPNAPEPHELVVWDGAGLGPDVPGQLGNALSLTVRADDGLAALGVTAPTGEQAVPPGRFAAAAALARLGTQHALPVDFLHSRLAPKKTSVLGRRTIWAAAVGTALVVAAALFVTSWREEEQNVADLHTRLDAMRADVDAARRVVDRVSFARRWFDRRPDFLECLRELTLAFPPEGSIWTTSLGVREDMRAVVSGKSVNEKTILDVLDQLKSAASFEDVKLLYMREAIGEARHVSFAISLAFVGGK